MYDDCVLRGENLHAMNGDKLYCVMAETLARLCSSFEDSKTVFERMQGVTAPTNRDASALAAAGYHSMAKVGDAFTASEARTVSQSLSEYVKFTCPRLRP
jgi:hypothetical protein